MKKLGRSNPQARDVARQGLQAIKVPDAVPAIELVFCANGGEYAAVGSRFVEGDEGGASGGSAGVAGRLLAL